MMPHHTRLAHAPSGFCGIPCLGDKVDACDPGRVKGVNPATEAGHALLPVLDGQPGTRFDALVNSP